jgi:hypothetical protein
MQNVYFVLKKIMSHNDKNWLEHHWGNLHNNLHEITGGISQDKHNEAIRHHVATAVAGAKGRHFEEFDRERKIKKSQKREQENSPESEIQEKVQHLVKREKDPLQDLNYDFFKTKFKFNQITLKDVIDYLNETPELQGTGLFKKFAANYKEPYDKMKAELDKLTRLHDALVKGQNAMHTEKKGVLSRVFSSSNK